MRTSAIFYWSFSAVVCAIALAGIAGPSLIPAWPLRVLVTLQAGWTFLRLATPPARTGLVSPLFLLPAIGLLFYVWLPVGYVLLDDRQFSAPEYHARNMSYSGSWAEYIVLQFVSLCFATAGLIRSGNANVPASAPALPGNLRRPVFAACLAIALACAIVRVMAGKFGLPIGPLWAFLPPIAFFCLALALLTGLGMGTAPLVAAIGVTTISLAAFIWVDLARMPLAFAGFAAIMMAVSSNMTTRRMVVTASALFVAIAVGAAAANSYRLLSRADGPSVSFGAHLYDSVRSKLLIRQTVSGWCFENARERHWNDREGRRYFDYLSGLVPRSLWPEKPNLSRGAEYAVRYCQADINPDKVHAEALTLLAEPIIQGGKWGLLSGEIAVIVFLGLGSLLMLRGGAVGLAASTALLPWLTAFEQHLAFYIANGTKMFLAMLPLMIALLLLRNFASGRQTKPCP